MQKINRVGETNINTNGSLMTIIEYNNANDIVVEFKDGYKNKEFKENYIKEVANEYKDKIQQKLYEAMYRYKVEIDN